MFRKYDSWYSRFDWRPNFNVVKRLRSGKKKKNFNFKTEEVAELIIKINSATMLKTSRVPASVRKINYIYDYLNIVKGNKINLFYRRIKLEKNFRNFPYKQNSVFRVVGTLPEYLGISEGKVSVRRTENLKTLNYILRKHDEFSELLPIFESELVDYREVLTPGYNTSTEHFKNYCKEPDIDRDVDETIRILNLSKFKFFRIPDFKEPEDGEIYDTVNFNRESSPGHYMKKLVASKRQGSIKYTSQAAEDLYTFMKDTVLKNYYLWDLLGREKDNKVIEDTEVSARLVMNTEEPMVILLSMFAQRLSKVIQNDPDNSMMIGKSLNRDISKKIDHLRSKYDWTLESDWTKFDSNITANDITVGGAVLCSGFDLSSKRMRRAVYLIISSIITKYVPISPGFVCRIDKGVPSGHPFTSLITSVINIVYWCLIGYEIYGNNYGLYMDILVQGDDANVFLQDHPNLARIDDIIEKLGIKSDKIAGNLIYNPGLINIQDCPVFLKRKTLNGQVIWNRKSIIRKLIYQTSKGKNFDDDNAILRNYILTAPDDDLMNKLLFLMIERNMTLKGECKTFIKMEIDSIRASLSTKRVENVFKDNVKDSSDFEKSILQSPEQIAEAEETKLLLIRRGKYILSLYLAFPNELDKIVSDRLRKIVIKRDAKYLNEFIGTGIPPPVILDDKNSVFYRFGPKKI